MNSKKLHNPILYGASNILKEVYLNLHATDITLDKAFKANKKWGSRDRKAVAELVYFSLRNFSSIVTNLELKYYQKINFDLLVKKSAHKLGFTTDLENPDFNNSADTFSLPIWLSDFLKVNQEDPNKIIYPQWKEGKVYFRLNPSKLSKEHAQKILNKAKIEFNDIKILPDGICLKRNEVKEAIEVLAGLGEIQDGSSQLLCRELPITKDMTVIDVCAGAGGKALYLSELLNEKNKILVHDTAPLKLAELEKRFKRNKRAYKILNTEQLMTNTNKADLVLIDTPCSGLGVLKRNPETLWQLTPQKLESLLSLQEELLKKYSTLVKPGGLLAYMTCSVLKCENDTQITSFLKTNPQFKLVKEIKIYDHSSPQISLDHFDGMYLALLAKDK